VLAPTARLGQFERPARDVAGIGQAPVAFEDERQPVERLGGLGTAAKGGEDIGSTVHRAVKGLSGMTT
jgi:hypothetical protein